jgi:hypothetical protein
MSKLNALSHKISRFLLTETETKIVAKNQIYSLIALIKDVGNIFFQLPKLFFHFPPYLPGQKSDSSTGIQIKLKSKDKNKRRRYGSVIRYAIHGLIEATIYCSNVLYH